MAPTTRTPPPSPATRPGPAPRRLSVALLECDHVRPELKGVAGDYGDMFTRLFARHTPHLDLHHLDVIGGDPLPATSEHDGIVISGSRHSVMDGLPWIDALTALVREAHDTATPVVGICFGHQLIAQALGGRVARADVGWGVGVHAARVTSHRPWMIPPAERFRLLVSHQDQVHDLPAGATVAATSDHAPVAAFEIGSLLGLQGHPEFVPAYADALLTVRAEQVGAPAVARARASLSTPTDHAVVAGWIASFLAMWAADGELALDAGG